MSRLTDALDRAGLWLLGLIATEVEPEPDPEPEPPADPQPEPAVNSDGPRWDLLDLHCDVIERTAEAELCRCSGSAEATIKTILAE